MRRAVSFAPTPSIYMYAPASSPAPSAGHTAYSAVPLFASGGHPPSAGLTAYSAAPLYTPGGHQGFFCATAGSPMGGTPMGGSPGLSLNLGQNYASPSLGSCSAPPAWGSAAGFPGLSIRAPTYAQPALTQSEYYARTVTAAEAYRGSACAPGYSGGADAAQRAAEAAQRQQALAQAYSSYYSGLPNLPSSP